MNTGIGKCMRFLLIFVRVWEIFDYVEIPDRSFQSEGKAPKKLDSYT